MELKSLRLFVVLADELHFGRAASRLGVTQSALSAQIKRLEDVVGAALFQRSTRHVRLTDVGAELRGQAESALRRVDEALAAARAKASGDGRVIRMGLTSAVLVSDVMNAIAAFRLENPGVRIAMREMGTIDQETALAKGDLDIGLLHPPVDQRALTLMELKRAPLVAAYNPAFFALTEKPEWPEVLAAPLVFYQRRRAPRLYAALLRCAAQAERDVANAAEAESFFAAAAMAQTGLGVALLPPDMARLHGGGLAVADLPAGGGLELISAVALPAATAMDSTVQRLARRLAA